MMKIPGIKPKWREFERRSRSVPVADDRRRSLLKGLFKGVFREMTQDRVELVANLLAKLVGETVQSKILRAVLMGGIAAATQLAQSDPDAVVTPPPAVFQAAPAPTQGDDK